MFFFLLLLDSENKKSIQIWADVKCFFFLLVSKIQHVGPLCLHLFIHFNNSWILQKSFQQRAFQLRMECRAVFFFFFPLAVLAGKWTFWRQVSMKWLYFDLKQEFIIPESERRHREHEQVGKCRQEEEKKVPPIIIIQVRCVLTFNLGNMLLSAPELLWFDARTKISAMAEEDDARQLVLFGGLNSGVLTVLFFRNSHQTTCMALLEECILLKDKFP